MAEWNDMGRSRWLALGAVMAALATAPAALAQDAGRQDATAPAVEAGAVAAPTGVAKPARTTRSTKTIRSPKTARAPRTGRRPAEAAQAPAPSEAYQLVPSPSGSALVRARQNSFGVRDEEGSSSGARSRHIGIGLGGGNGTTPGMAIGF